MNLDHMPTENYEAEFIPPSFEPWLGRLQMLRLLASMGGFIFTFLVSWSFGLGWEQATIRGIIAGIVLHFVAWAVALFVFGEVYDAEVQSARVQLEQRERDRIKRQQEYYRERLLAKGIIDTDGNVVPGNAATIQRLSALRTTPIDLPVPEQQSRAA